MLVVVELKYDEFFEKKNIIPFETEAEAHDYCFKQIYDLYAYEVWPYLESEYKLCNDPKQQLELSRDMSYDTKVWDVNRYNDGLYSYIDTEINWGKILIIVDIDE